jgi:toxin ParE1/3/4
MNPAYTIRQAAESDLEEIWLYSYEQWGVEQADKYLRSLFARFTWLAENPNAGKQRDDVKPGYYSFPEGLRIVFYKIKETGIEVIGIPHQNMDWIKHFE